MIRLARPLSLVLVSSLLVACAQGPEPETPPPPSEPARFNSPTTPGAMAAAPVDAPSPDAQKRVEKTPAKLPEKAPEPPPLTDEQIVHVLHTTNLGELERAKLAQKRGKDPNVKKLAAMMSRDHADADEKGAELAKKAKLTLTENPVSATLERDAKKNTEAMDKETGPAFDRAYVDAQVKEHEVVLETIVKKLLPAAKNEDLKAFLGTLRERVALHLEHAKKTRAALGGS